MWGAEDSVRTVTETAPAPDLDPARHTVRRVLVRDDVELAYAHAGPAGGGGFPLLLVHGWPETMRIWWRNIGALAEAGFEVIAPDLRGFGASSLAGDGAYDAAAHARDLHALVHDVLGHERCVASGGDLGGPVILDLGLRFPGFVARQVLFNCPLPLLPDAYAAAGIDTRVSPEVRQAADYFVRQGREPDALAAELANEGMRRRYIATFYTSRFWAHPGSFDRDAVDFMTEPWADGAKMRASFGAYEGGFNAAARSGPSAMAAPNPTPTMILFGTSDHVLYPDYDRMAAVVFPNHVGPFLLRDCGHFVQWEAAHALNSAITAWCGDAPSSHTHPDRARQ